LFVAKLVFKGNLSKIKSLAERHKHQSKTKHEAASTLSDQPSNKSHKWAEVRQRSIGKWQQTRTCIITGKIAVSD